MERRSIERSITIPRVPIRFETRRQPGRVSLIRKDYTQKPIRRVDFALAQGCFDLPVDVPSAMSTCAYQHHCHGRISDVSSPYLANNVFSIVAVDDVLAIRTDDLRNEDILNSGPVPDKFVNLGPIAPVVRNEVFSERAVLAEEATNS
jgi:hypothetical protein